VVSNGPHGEIGKLLKKLFKAKELVAGHVAVGADGTAVIGYISGLNDDEGKLGDSRALAVEKRSQLHQSLLKAFYGREVDKIISAAPTTLSEIELHKSQGYFPLENRMLVKFPPPQPRRIPETNISLSLLDKLKNQNQIERAFVFLIRYFETSLSLNLAIPSEIINKTIEIVSDAAEKGFADNILNILNFLHNFNKKLDPNILQKISMSFEKSLKRAAEIGNLYSLLHVSELLDGSSIYPPTYKAEITNLIHQCYFTT
jgi:hypothetical protein